jgi:hypothetical protein
VTRGAVALEREGQEVLVRAGERIDVLPDRPLGDPVPRGGTDGDAEEDPTRASLKREVGLAMAKEEVMAAAAEEIRRAEYQEGKTLIDVNGRRVRLEEYIIRGPREAADPAKAFKLVVLNEREDRFDYFYYRGEFNQDLPTDLSVALNDVRGKLNAQPDYYLRAYEMGQSNTVDSIKDTASGGHLVNVTFDGTNYTLTNPSDPNDTRTIAADETVVADGITYHKIYDPVADRFVTVTDEQFGAGDWRASVYDGANDLFRPLETTDSYWRTSFNGYEHRLNNVLKQSYLPKSGVTSILSLDNDADFTYAGGSMMGVTETPSGADQLHNRVTLFYGDGTFET